MEAGATVNLVSNAGATREMSSLLGTSHKAEREGKKELFLLLPSGPSVPSTGQTHQKLGSNLQGSTRVPHLRPSPFYCNKEQRGEKESMGLEENRPGIKHGPDLMAEDTLLPSAHHPLTYLALWDLHVLLRFHPVLHQVSHFPFPCTRPRHPAPNAESGKDRRAIFLSGNV